MLYGTVTIPGYWRLSKGDCHGQNHDFAPHRRRSHRHRRDDRAARRLAERARPRRHRRDHRRHGLTALLFGRQEPGDAVGEQYFPHQMTVACNHLAEVHLRARLSCEFGAFAR